jgi:hypothetical protein
MDSKTINSLIISLSIIAATIVGSITALRIGRQMFRRQKLRQNLNQAVGDIRFLIAVEESHCERSKSSDGETFKLRARSALRDKPGVDFSGRIQPG